MTRLVHSAAAVSNPVGEMNCTKPGKFFHPIVSVMRAAQALWPRKTAAELSSRTGLSERTCKYWLAKKFALSTDALIALLHSDDGLFFLEAVMGDERPAWWRTFKRRLQLEDLKTRQTQLGKLLDEIEADRRT